MQLLEVKLKESHDFQIVMETLRRIGTVKPNTNTVQQEVFILHKTGRYYLLHYTELLTLDGKLSKVPESGIATRNTVATLLHNWQRLTLIAPDKAANPQTPMKEIIVVPFRDKGKWEFVSMYEIGKDKTV